MRRIVIFLIVLILFFTVTASGEGIEDIERKLNTDKLEEIIPESLSQNEDFSDLEISYSQASGALSLKNVLGKILSVFFKGLKGEIAFVSTVAAFLIVSSVYSTFADGTKNALPDAVNFAVSAFICTVVYSHVLSSLDIMTSYVEELTGFMTSLLPFLATALCMQGAGTEAVTGSAILIAVLTLVEKVSISIVVPLVKILFAFICAGFITKINFSPITDYVTSFASKTCTITMSIISAVLYFQHALASSADSLALRSVKLAAGNLIPIVGSMVAEASSTVIAGVKLVKTTLGLFAVAVLLYMTLGPIMTFITRKISLKLLSALSSLLGNDSSAKVISSVYGVYNIMSALMFSVCTFFVFAVAILVKSGGV